MYPQLLSVVEQTHWDIPQALGVIMDVLLNNASMSKIQAIICQGTRPQLHVLALHPC